MEGEGHGGCMGQMQETGVCVVFVACATEYRILVFIQAHNEAGYANATIAMLRYFSHAISTNECNMLVETPLSQ